MVKDEVNEKLVFTGTKTEEMKELRRLARARVKLGRYGLEILDPMSNAFPGIRAIRDTVTGDILREFSCEEELIKCVLGNGKFDDVLERRNNLRSGRKTVSYFTDKG